MSFFDDPPLRDFPDRAIRRLQEDRHHLRELITDLVPELADRFDFDRAETLDRSFLLENWRERELDLLFRVPFRASGSEIFVFVCILIEHQSSADPIMPLRMLLYAVLFWEQEWKNWKKNHPRGEPLRLTPILPVVLHTGESRWSTNRELADLIEAPEEFKAFSPRWAPLFWDIAEKSPQTLLDSAGPWLKALAVVRAEKEETEEFLRVFGECLRSLESLSESDNVRWHDMLWFLLSWALRRRPRREGLEIVRAAQSSQANVARQEEIETMSKTIEKTWEQEMFERGEASGAKRGVVALRGCLREVLESHFGPLPEEWLQRIDGCEDLNRLKGWIVKAGRINSLDELQP